MREMEKKLDLTTCSDDTGAARTWCDSYCDTHADPAQISWEEFAKTFREHHVPEGVMDAKVEEFCNISWGSQNI